MNQAENILIDWDAPNLLEQLVQNIKAPLENIAAAGRNSDEYNKEKIEEIIFSSTKEISDIIEAIVAKNKARSLSLTHESRPDIFKIYESNENIRQMCMDAVTPQKVTKVDQDWLMSFEKAVYDNLSNNFLNLCELSYKMAVSERQLYRRILSLVALTPNKYIRILRLHKAKQMIDNFVDHSIPQIAYAVGYNDVHYFSKLFASQYSVSPKELLGSLR
ncbi:helix-turn-helix domain-containing protein [Hymenobacter tenuis]